MSKPWSDNPYAPKIPYSVYAEEKTDVAGILIAAILYGACKISPPPYVSNCAHFVYLIHLGILIVLFFQCMTALFSPVNRQREGIKWGLVSYTVLMFSFATVLTGMGLNIESLSYIDNREFPGGEGIPPGPLGYRLSIWSGALTVTPRLMFLFNNWLADGLLVSFFVRCCVYSSRCLTLTPPALSLLHNLLREPLGHRHPLRRVPRFRECVF